MESETIALADADALRDHLDALNESGTDYKAVGMDVGGNAFLVCLAGPYAESVVVMFGNPWDGEVDYGTGTHCDECAAQEVAGVERLRFPVHVLVQRP